MDGQIQYLNTDLDIASCENLADLAAHFVAKGLHALHVSKRQDESWYATFETDDTYDNPEGTIAAMLDVIESLPQPKYDIWSRSTRRDFNIGYDCGNEPWEFNQALSSELLSRLAKVGGSIRITIYPDRVPNT